MIQQPGISWDVEVYHNHSGECLYKTTMTPHYVREYMRYIERLGFYDARVHETCPYLRMIVESEASRLTIIVGESETFAKREEEEQCSKQQAQMSLSNPSRQKAELGQSSVKEKFLRSARKLLPSAKRTS